MKSQSDRFIVAAFEKGYRADDEGNVYSPSGKIMKLRVNKSGYYNLCVSCPGITKRNYSVILAHRFIAYCRYKELLFDNYCVRHLDGNKQNNSKENLVLGSQSDNRRDIPKKLLREAALKNLDSTIERLRTLSDEDILNMRKERETNDTPYHEIASKFGVSTMTAHRAITKKSWKNI